MLATILALLHLDPNSIIPVLLLAVALFNIIMSAVAQVFAAMSKTEPGWLQSIGAWGLKISQWLTANTPTPPKA